MLFKVLARLGFPPKIINLMRVFHENVTIEVDLDDDGNTIIISHSGKYDIGVKQGWFFLERIFIDRNSPKDTEEEPDCGSAHCPPSCTL